MLYNTNQLGGRIPLNSIPRISFDEAINYIEVIPTITSKRLGKCVVSLENANKYMNKHDVTLTNFLEEVSYINSVPYENIAFSVKPSSIYRNNTIREMYINLNRQNIPIYLCDESNTNEAKTLNYIYEECLRLNSVEPLNILIEGWLDSIGSGAVQGGGNAIIDFARNTLNRTAENFRQGVVNSADNKIQDWIGNTFGLDKKGTEKVLDKQKGVIDKEVTIRNGNLENKLNQSKLFNNSFMNKHATLKKNLVDFAGGVVSDVRSGLSQGKSPH